MDIPTVVVTFFAAFSANGRVRTLENVLDHGGGGGNLAVDSALIGCTLISDGVVDVGLGVGSGAPNGFAVGAGIGGSARVVERF
jgi:hypothetical protein